MATPFSIVDRGHAEPAAVVLLRAPEGESWMAGLAAFLRLPVTAFAWPAPGGFRVRMYAPATELEFSGGGLVAVAHALWRAELVPPSRPVAARTGSGDLEARRAGLAVEVRQAGRVVFSAPEPRTVGRGELTWPT